MRKTNVKLSVSEKKRLVASGRITPWSRTILGEPASKANSRKIVTINGKLRSIRSDKARSYADDFAKQCPVLDPLFEGDVIVELRIYYGSRRPDLDESIILDCLQGRVYRNDRQVRAKVIYGEVDPVSPRVDIHIRPMAMHSSSGDQGQL